MNKTSLFLVGIVFLFSASACSMMKGKELAAPAVERFHSQFNAKQFKDIYNESDEEFKKTVTEQQLTELLEAVHRKLGTVTKATQTGWHVNASTEGTIVTVGYDVDFSEGKGAEQFNFRISGDKAFLYHYNVNSPLLITR